MTKQIKCIINNDSIETTESPGMATLDFIRRHQSLPGTKEGCREGECGACTVLLGEINEHGLIYKSVASCMLPLGELAGKHIITVEGINIKSNLHQPVLNPIQQALTEEGASQCGFCTPGIVMSITAFFLTSQTLDYNDAIDALDGNICRCTGYVPIQRAVKKLVEHFAPGLKENRKCLPQLVEWKILPDYILDIPERLQKIKQEKQPQIDPDDILVAGATDLLVQKPEELKEKKLAFLSQIEELKGIRIQEGNISIGGGVTVEEMKLSPVIKDSIPNIKEYLNLVSSAIMRNRATLAGNIVNASPIGDLSIILLALDAKLILKHGKNIRKVQLKKFFQGYKQMDLNPGEIVERIILPLPARDHAFHFEKISQRKYLDIASCNTAISINTNNNCIEKIHLSAGGVAPIPLYLEQTCTYLKQKEMSPANISKALSIATGEIAPISDVRGTAEYKSQLLRHLIVAHFMTLFPHLNLQEALK
jgi:xanthine dehydrogenase small subunit